MDVINFIIFGALLGLAFLIGAYFWVGAQIQKNRQRLGLDERATLERSEKKGRGDALGEIFRTLYRELKREGVDDATLLGDINQFASRCDGKPWKAEQVLSGEEIAREEITLYDAALFLQAVSDALEERPEGVTKGQRGAIRVAASELNELNEGAGE